MTHSSSIPRPAVRLQHRPDVFHRVFHIITQGGESRPPSQPAVQQVWQLIADRQYAIVISILQRLAGGSQQTLLRLARWQGNNLLASIRLADAACKRTSTWSGMFKTRKRGMRATSQVARPLPHSMCTLNRFSTFSRCNDVSGFWVGAPKP